MFYDYDYVENLKKRYPRGTRIELDMMSDAPRPIPPGTKGTVDHVDDIGTIHCHFDNGRYLGVVPGEDSFHIISSRSRDIER